MKKITGGYYGDEGGDDFGEAKACTKDSDCGTKGVVCNGVTYQVDGKCRFTESKCYWSVSC